MSAGVALILLGMLLQAAGEALQKRGIAASLPVGAPEGLSGVGRRTIGRLLSSGPWRLGLAASVLGVVAVIQAIALLDVSSAAPFGGVKVVFALGIAILVLRERIARAERTALAAIACGAVLLAASAGETGQFRIPVSTSLALAALAACVSCGLLLAARRARAGRELALAVAAGVQFAAVNVLLKGATERAVTAGGSFSLLDAAELAVLVGRPELWLAALSQVAGFLMLQAAFALGRYGVVTPVASLSITTVSVALAVGLYHEQPGALRLVGIATVVVGAAALWAHSSRTRAAADDVPLAR